MVLVFQIAMIESVREGVPTLYFEVSTVKRSNTTEEQQDLLQSFKTSVRKRFKQMEACFRRNGISYKTVRSEDALNLSLVLPILLEHERRCCLADGKNVWEEFIKRFLVVSLFTDAVLDLYYDENNDLCSVQLSVMQEKTIHWFMYFCLSSRAKCGIWYHGILQAMVRGLTIPSIEYVNAQVHQTDSKRGAGMQVCDHIDCDMLRNLYPFEFTKEMPLSALETRLWASDTTGRPTKQDEKSTKTTKQC